MEKVNSILSVVNDPAVQTGVQSIGAAAVFWVLTELREIRKRIAKVEKKLKIPEE